MVSFCVFTLYNAINVLMFQNELVQVDVGVMRGKKMFSLCRKVGENLATPTHTNRKVQDRIELFLMDRCKNYGHVGGYILDFRNNIHSILYRLMFLTQPSVLF
jgi:hypothetical protein